MRSGILRALVPATLLVATLLVATPSAMASPSVSIGDVSVVEGNAGIVAATFTVAMTETSADDVSVGFATADDSATAPDDYTAVSGGLLTIPAGETSGEIVVQVIGDLVDEPDETFFVNLSDPVNADLVDPQAIGTITDDDAAEAVECTIEGTSGSDTINGSEGDDVICGFQGRDTIYGLGGNDTIFGNQGKDVIEGGEGNDTVFGGNGKDLLTGGGGSDALFGKNGKDSLDSVDGVSGNDISDGGRGKDNCSLDEGDSVTSCR